MINENISYPHPVLGLSDDISGKFSLQLDVERNAETRMIEITISELLIENDYIQSLISLEKASLLMKVYCSSTFKSFTFLNPTDKIKIFEDEVCNTLKIEPLIVAIQDIPDYLDQSFNPEYGGQSFFVNKYEAIGLLGTVTLAVDKVYEKMGLGNIFEFEPEDDSTKPISYHFGGDKIIVKYPITPEGDHPPAGLFHKAPWTAFNILAIPALTEAFRIMADEKKCHDIEGNDWFYVLNNLLPKHDRDENPFNNAQLILEKQIPLLKAFDELCNN